METENLDVKLFENLKSSQNRKDEIFLIDEFINRHQSDENYNDSLYTNIFNLLLETKLTCAIRLLSRNKKVQKELLKQTTVSYFEEIIDKLTKTKINDKLSEMLDNIFIEVISIIKRFLNSDVQKENPDFFNMILQGSLIDHLIFLMGKDNMIILKLLHMLLLSLLDNAVIVNKLIITYAVENMIIGVRDKNREISKIMLDFLIVLVENKDFRNLFMFLEGHMMLINKLKNYEKIDKEIILKILYILQRIYKNEELVNEINSLMIFNLFTILTNNSEYQINKQILTILSAFALNDDSNILIRMNWLEVLLKLLLNYSFRLREEASVLSEKEKSSIIINQTLIVRILRLIFSLEKNRKFFKQLFPTKLLSMFIDIGNYKHSLNLYTSFITELNSLTDEDLREIQIKCENIKGMSSEAGNINQTIGGYSIVELIGKGGFGSVYKVKINNQYFAMKEIKLEEKELRLLKGNTSTRNIEKVISEIDIWKDLDHPNIIRYYTSFMEKDKNNVYIIMELVEGVNLSEYMSNLREKGAKPKEKEIIKLLIDVVCGLKYLHKEKGVLYRDVNPHNIMIDNNFNVKMGDFGLAKKLKRETEDNLLDSTMNNLSHSMSSGFVGSILYSSPEMIKNEDYTEKSDLWSLGCVLYELLSFSAPFEGDNPLTVAKNIVELNYKRLNMNDFEHPVLVNIIKRCLVQDPEERIDINEMCGYLGPYFADKINFFKRSEYELKNENEYLNEKIYKLETAFANLTSNGSTSGQTGALGNMINEQGGNTNQGIEFTTKKNSANTISKFNPQSKTDVFKQSTFKRISDPLTKILEMINKIMFLTNEGNIKNPKDEKFTFITKFKRKLFLSSRNINSSNNANIIKSEIMKLINFSKETINFEGEDREVPFNSTGMKSEIIFKTRITYELMYHFIEELLIINDYY